MAELTTLSMWVVYDHPTDAPASYVVRRWEIGPGRIAPDEAKCFDFLEEARYYLAMESGGAVRLEPSPDDDPAICEVWV